MLWFVFLTLSLSSTALGAQTCTNSKSATCIEENGLGQGCDTDGADGACCSGVCCDSNCKSWCCYKFKPIDPGDIVAVNPGTRPDDVPLEDGDPIVGGVVIGDEIHDVDKPLENQGPIVGGVVIGDIQDAPFTYQEPPWWKRMQATFDGVNLKKCASREFPPEKHSRCSRRDKTCFFGAQPCPSVGSHPQVKCICSESQWSCETEACPPG